MAITNPPRDSLDRFAPAVAVPNENRNRFYEIICSECGLATGEFTRVERESYQVWKCCKDLPSPWGEGELEDDEHGERCTCFDCRFNSGNLTQDEIDGLTDGECWWYYVDFYSVDEAPERARTFGRVNDSHFAARR